MTEKRPLFRPEAVEYHAQARTSHRTLDLKERRTVWLFRGLLIAIATVVGLAFVVPAETTAHGAAVIEPKGTEAVVTMTDVRRVGPGQDVTIDLGGTSVGGQVAAVEQPPVGTFGFPVRVTLATPAPAGAKGEASIKLGRMSIANLLRGKD